VSVHSIRRTLKSAAASAMLILLSAAPAWAAEATPREVADYGKAFGVSKAKAEANLEAQERGTGITDELEDRLGPEYAGVWFDNEAGEFVVPVLANDRAQANLTKAGAELAEQGLAGDYRTEAAQSSWDALEAAQEEIDAQLPGLTEPGQARTSLDAAANAVVIEFSGQTTRQEEAALRALAGKAGVAVELQKSDQPRFEASISACNSSFYCGDPLRGGVKLNYHNGPTVCTIGFRARGFDSKWYVLTAGHCLNKWWEPVIHWASKDDNNTQHYIGQLADFEFPGHDWAKIDATGSDWDIPGWTSKVAKWNNYLNQNFPAIVNEHYPIDGEANPYQGQFVYHTGITTGTSGGEVKTTNQTLTEVGTQYGKVTITNLARVESTANEDVCVDNGDSGGPVYAQSTGLGLLSVGENAFPGIPCFDSKYWFVKLPEATSDLGVSVYGGPPSVTTGSATNVGPYQATLHGDVNPNAWITHSRFEYGKGSYSHSTPEYYDSSGTSWISRSRTVTDLDPASSYQFRIKATSALGTTYGSKGTFETPPAPPKATTEAVSGVHVAEETGKATLNGQVNPGGAQTDWRFEWGTVASGQFPNSVPVPDGDAGSGIAFVPVQGGIEGLKGLTEYHYRLRAENSEGTVTSSVAKFTTPDWRPEVSADDVGPEGPYAHEGTGKIRLSGDVNPNGFATKYHFEWATQEEFEAEEFNNSSPEVEVGNCVCDEGVEQVVEGLKGSTTYHYRLVGENAEGKKTDTSSDTFKTPNWKPSALADAGDVGAEEATLVAWIVSDSFATTYRFEWADQEEFEAEEYGHVIEGEEPIATTFENRAIEVSAPIDGLKRWETYHFRVVVENAEGTGGGGDRQFTTSTGGFKATDYPTTVTATPEGTFVVSMTSLGLSLPCTAPTLEGTIEGGEESFEEGNDRLTTSASGSFECEAPPHGAIWTMEMNGCSFQLDPGYGSESSFGGELNIGPPGCGPVSFGNASCQLSIPPQIGRDAAFLNEGGGWFGQKVKATVAIEDLRYEMEGGGLCGVGTKADGGISGTWTLEGEDEEEEPAGVWVSPFVGGGPGASGEVTEVTATTALYEGSIVTLGDFAVWGIEYGTTDSYGSIAPGGVIPEGSEDPVEVEAEPEELMPETTYHYRVVALNDQGITYGDDETFTTGAFRPTQFAAAEYPATIEGANDVSVDFEMPSEGISFKCEVAELSGSISEGTSALSLAPALSGTEEKPEAAHCNSTMGTLIVKPNSCELLFGVDNAGPPYSGGLEIACAEEGDQIEFVGSSGCHVKIAPQVPGGSLAYESAAGKVSAEGSATEVQWTAPGFVCGIGGIAKEGEDGVLAVDASLEARNEAEEATDLFVSPPEEVPLFMAGEEGKEGDEPRIEALGYPATIEGANDVSVDFEMPSEEISFKCEVAELSGSISEGTSVISLAPALSGTEENPEAAHCASTLGTLTVQPNSCELLFGVDNAGPPYSGGLEIACAEEGDQIEFVSSSGCHVKIAPQVPGGSLAYESAAGKVSAEGSATEVQWTAPGFICGFGGIAKEGEDGVLGVDASLAAIYGG